METKRKKKEKKRKQDRGCHLAAQTYKVLQPQFPFLFHRLSLCSIFLWFSHNGKSCLFRRHMAFHTLILSFFMLFIHLKMLPPLFLSHLTEISVKYNLCHEAYSDSSDRICCPFQCILIVSISSFQTEIISWLVILNAFWV